LNTGGHSKGRLHILLSLQALDWPGTEVSGETKAKVSVHKATHPANQETAPNGPLSLKIESRESHLQQ
jgi:hypothetical protein